MVKCIKSSKAMVLIFLKRLSKLSFISYYTQIRRKKTNAFSWTFD